MNARIMTKVSVSVRHRTRETHKAFIPCAFDFTIAESTVYPLRIAIISYAFHSLNKRNKTGKRTHSVNISISHARQ